MEAEELKAPSFTNQERLRIECTRYQEMGGLPGLYQIEGELERKREMKARVDLTLFRDLLEVFEIRQPGRLSALFSFLVSNASQVVNYSTITNALTLKYETLKNYLDYLELSHLIFQVDQYTPNPLKTISRNPKIYLADHAFFQLWDCDEGLMVENLCFVHLQQLAKQHWTTTLNYWVGKGREEVDMVIPTDKGPLPVEIKFRQTITKSQLKGLRNFSKEFDTQRALLITLKDEGPLELETGAGTLCVLKLPLWKFLLLD